MKNFYLKTLFIASVIVLGANANANKFAFGVERTTFVDGAMNTLHGHVDVMPGGSAGANFGFDNDFDSLYLGGDFKYDLMRTNASGVFAKGTLGFVKGVLVGGAGDNSGFSAGALLGFEYSLTANLRLSMAYGLQFMFGYGDSVIGLTNNDAFGNFGVHWYF
jgi:hypothetical protein